MTFLLMFSITLNFILWDIYNKDIQICNALNNDKAVVYTYLINNEKYIELKKILANDMIQLIHDYDKNLFKKSRVLSSICSDWRSIIKPSVLHEINLYNKVEKNNSYWTIVREKFNIIDEECKMRRYKSLDHQQ